MTGSRALVPAAFVAAFAIFHGHAHGTEMPIDANGLAYGAGFALMTALLHGLGIVAGLWSNRLFSERFVRASGGAITVAGLALLLLV